MVAVFKDINDENKFIHIELNKFIALIPQEFKDIKGDYTVFELVALWNKDYLTDKDLGFKPYFENFRGMDEYEKNMYREKGKTEEEIAELDKEFRRVFYEESLEQYNSNIDKIQDFKILSDMEMKDKYGKDYLHEIGVAIYRSDSLKYPLKLTYDIDTNIKYESTLKRSYF